jgi:hypothetical protein
MPALVAGIHALDNAKKEDVDGRDALGKVALLPGHNERRETS